MSASMPSGKKRAPDFITDGSESPCGCWELNSGHLEEETVLLTTEPSLQPLNFLGWMPDSTGSWMVTLNSWPCGLCSGDKVFNVLPSTYAHTDMSTHVYKTNSTHKRK